MTGRACVDPLRTLLDVVALEGWHPHPEDAAVLALVEAGAPRRRVRELVGSSIPPEARAPLRPGLLARRRPYLLRSGDVLHNRIGITDGATLDHVEGLLSVDAGARLLRRPPEGVRGVSDVHAMLFGEIYPWAGLPRIVDLRRGDSRFLSADGVPRELPRVERPPDAGVSAPDHRHAARILADWYARYNAVHPFREGNGRAAAVTACLWASEHGLALDFSRTDRDSWVAAGRASLAPAHGRTVDHRPHLREFLRIVRSPEPDPL